MADMQINRQAIDWTIPEDVPEGAYRPTDQLLAFLNAL